MTPERLTEVLGVPPIPQGTWEDVALVVVPVSRVAAVAALGPAGPRPHPEGAHPEGPETVGSEKTLGSGGHAPSDALADALADAPSTPSDAPSDVLSAVAADLARRVRELPGVGAVRVRNNGFVEIELAEPGEIVREIVTAVTPPIRDPAVTVPGRRLAEAGGAAPAGAPRAADGGHAIGVVEARPGARGGRVWPDFPRTWENPGFVVRYAHARAAAVARWARDLGVPGGPFRPEVLAGRHDRAALRALAELPGRRRSRDPAWPAYFERLAATYHDAHERAPALPQGDLPVTAEHVARVWLARAVRLVLAEGLMALGEVPPDKL